MNSIQELTVWFLPVLFAITFHEVAHGWVALQFGDRTALRAGRLTLNPINHIDLVGTIIVPLLMLLFSGIVFGWAKPVPVNAYQLRNPKRDMAFVALAGPLANLLMAVFWAMIAKFGILSVDHYPITAALIYMGKAGIRMNLLLFVFNLFPIPPLDGSKVFMSFLPNRLAWQYSKLEPYGFFILLALIYIGMVGQLLWPPLLFLQGLIFGLFGL